MVEICHHGCVSGNSQNLTLDWFKHSSNSICYFVKHFQYYLWILFLEIFWWYNFFVSGDLRSWWGSDVACSVLWRKTEFQINSITKSIFFVSSFFFVNYYPLYMYFVCFIISCWYLYCYWYSIKISEFEHEFLIIISKIGRVL